MKTILSLLFSISLMSLQGQMAIDNLFEKFKNSDDATAINMQGGLLNSMLESKELKSTIDGLKVLIIKESESSNIAQNSIRSQVRKSGLEELLSVNEKGAKVTVMAADSEDFISELVVMVNDLDDQNLVLVNMTGTIYYDDLDKLDLDFEGSDALIKAKECKQNKDHK